MTVDLGGQYCRVLSGQRRPEVSRQDGLRYAAESIEACMPHAAAAGVTLIIENHYKDNYWQYPEFAQKIDVFCDLVDRIDSPHFGVNYDPSNTILAGEDPLELLERVKHRVVTMHASDRYLAEGTIEDLRREEDSVGYAKRLSHGEIGKGMNDYDAIFGTLAGVGFDGWISIEDGVDGMDQLRKRGLLAPQDRTALAAVKDEGGRMNNEEERSLLVFHPSAFISALRGPRSAALVPAESAFPLPDAHRQASRASSARPGCRSARRPRG